MRGVLITTSSINRPQNPCALWTPMVLAIFLISLAICPNRLAAQRPFGATDVDQSSFALGSFALNVVFLESNGARDPNQEDWTAAQLTNMHHEIDQAASYWENQTASYHPNARLDITINYVNNGVPLETKYEPINNSGGNTSNYWINEVMGSLGYTNTSAKANTQAFNNDQRDALETHWAATVYVVNDTVDEDNKFTDKHFAFSFHGGPYIVTTYDNNGWLNVRYGGVLAHEMGHVFFALDEYYASGERNTNMSGYLGGINGNAERSVTGAKVTPPQPNALMLNITGSNINDNYPLSEFSRVQVGHRDSDNDTIPDILDTFPELSDIVISSDASVGMFSLSATGSVNPLQNLNPKVWADSGSDITINTIASGEYNLDGLGWVDFNASDGAYGDYIESLGFELVALSYGHHIIDVRITNSVGNYSDIESYELFVTPEPGTLGMVCLGLLAWVRRGRRSRHAVRPT